MAKSNYEMTHDEAIELMFDEYKKANKKKYTDLFLSNLSRGKVSFGLQTLSAMKNFHRHFFSRLNSIYIDDLQKRDKLVSEDHKKPLLERSYITISEMTAEQKEKEFENYQSYCHICSSSLHEKLPFDLGSYEMIMPAKRIYTMLEVLKETNKSVLDSPVTESDFSVIIETMQEIIKADSTDGIRHIYKKLKKSLFYKTWKSLAKSGDWTEINNHEMQLQYLLEVLGWLGVIHTSKHKGAFYEFHPYADDPRSSHHSDWDYPVDFWRGKDGIGWDAFDYWFSEYPQLQSIKR